MLRAEGKEDCLAFHAWYPVWCRYCRPLGVLASDYKHSSIQLSDFSPLFLSVRVPRKIRIWSGLLSTLPHCPRSSNVPSFARSILIFQMHIANYICRDNIKMRYRKMKRSWNWYCTKNGWNLLFYSWVPNNCLFFFHVQLSLISHRAIILLRSFRIEFGTGWPDYLQIFKKTKKKLEHFLSRRTDYR